MVKEFDFENHIELRLHHVVTSRTVSLVLIIQNWSCSKPILSFGAIDLPQCLSRTRRPPVINAMPHQTIRQSAVKG